MFKTQVAKLFIDRIKQIPHLHFEKTLLSINKYDNFFLNNNADCQEKASSQIYQELEILSNLILERTESELHINFIFEEKENITETNLEHIQFDILKNCLKTKFVNSKKIFLKFPQIFSNSYSSLNDVKYFESFNAVFILQRLEEKLRKENESKFDFIQINNLKDKEIETLIQKPIKNYDIRLKTKGINSAFGGSFDHMHIGHYMLLSSAAWNTQSKITIGITSDNMLSLKDDHLLTQSYEIREKNIISYFENIGYNKQVEIKPINDNLGTTSSDSTLDTLILTEETKKGGELVNKKRIENNLPPLNLIYAKIISGKEQQEQSKNIDITHLVSESPSGEFKNKISSKLIRKNIKLICPHLDKLFENWSTLLTNNEINQNEISNWWSVIRDYYSQPWRTYHNLNHINDCLCILNKIEKEISIEDENSILFAIWFHDVIYVPSAKDNEDRSIKLFESFCLTNFKGNINIESNINLSKIKSLILNTKYHNLDHNNLTDNDAKIFLDIDLSILGQNHEKYVNYITNLRKEYFEFSDDQWIKGRKKFVESVLSKKRIYLSEYFHNEYDESARNNLNYELNTLI